jgi:hypothetical protein
MRRDPQIHFAAVPGLMLGRPAVVEHMQPLGIGASGIEPERQHPASILRVGLGEDRTAVGQGHRTCIVKAAHSGQCAEVMVEGTVLLHQENEMVDVAQRGGRRRGGRLHAARRRRRCPQRTEQRRSAECRRTVQKSPPRHLDRRGGAVARAKSVETAMCRHCVIQHVGKSRCVIIGALSPDPRFHSGEQLRSSPVLVVRARGLEPPRHCWQQILSLPRLPFRHARKTRCDYSRTAAAVNGGAARIDRERCLCPSASTGRSNFWRRIRRFITSAAIAAMC